MDRTDILWHCATLESSEHGRLEDLEGGWRLTGVTVLPIGDVPGHLEYAVTTDGDWVTRSAWIAIHDARTSSYEIEIEVDDGIWLVNGLRRDDLDGCVDVDLGWTPATNILPLRRLGLEIAGSATTTAAWFRFPEMDIEANVQRYTRLGERRWRYESGPYDFVLDVDELGRVVKYGDELWRAVAAT